MASPSFFSELKRRQIYRGGVMYVVAGWVIVQIATQVFPFFQIPDWAIRLVVVVIMLGFPLALVALWMFESNLPDPEARLHDRRQGRDTTDAVARLMETERAERQRQNAELIAALGQLKAGTTATQATAADGRPQPAVAAAMAEEATPAAQPAAAEPPARRRRASTLLLSILALCIVLSGIWALVAPDAALQPVAASGELTRQYVVPGFSQIQHASVRVLAPILRKLGLHVAPERVFLGLVVLVGLMVLRGFYRQFSGMRLRRARQS